MLQQALTDLRDDPVFSARHEAEKVNYENSSLRHLPLSTGFPNRGSCPKPYLVHKFAPFCTGERNYCLVRY